MPSMAPGCCFRQYFFFKIEFRLQPIAYLLHTRPLPYDTLMATMKQMSLRLSATQARQLKELSDKLQIAKANVIRLALARLAEQEGLNRAE